MNRRQMKLLALPLACVMVAGCGSEEDMQGLIAQASARLDGIPSGRGTIPAHETAAKAYADVRSILQPVLEGGLPAEQAAASLIIAETEFAEASATFRDATDRHREALERLMEVESLLSVWQVAETRRSLAATFDVSDERRQLQDEIAELEGSIATQREELAALESELEDTNARILELSAKANGERAEAAKLEIQADAADAKAALPLITEAQRHSRQADGYVMQAEKLRGQLERLSTRIDRQKLRISGDQSARQVRVEDLSALTEAEQFHAQRAREATGEADAIRAELTTALFGADGLAAYYAGELSRAMEEAESAFSKAQRSARNAGELRQESQLLIGRIAQARGQALLNQARGLTRFRRTLERLAAIEAIAKSEPRIASRASELRQSEIEAYGNAAEAIESASSAFGSAGMSGDARDMLDVLQAELAQSRQAAQDHIADLGGDPSSGG